MTIGEKIEEFKLWHSNQRNIVVEKTGHSTCVKMCAPRNALRGAHISPRCRFFLEGNKNKTQQSIMVHPESVKFLFFDQKAASLKFLLLGDELSFLFTVQKFRLFFGKKSWFSDPGLLQMYPTLAERGLGLSPPVLSANSLCPILEFLGLSSF